MGADASTSKFFWGRGMMAPNGPCGKAYTQAVNRESIGAYWCDIPRGMAFPALADCRDKSAQGSEGHKALNAKRRDVPLFAG